MQKQLNIVENLDVCETMLNKMQEYTDKNLKGYQDYALKKYGKLSNDSIPYPETEPLNLGQIEIKTEPKSNEESDFEDFYNRLYTHESFKAYPDFALSYTPISTDTMIDGSCF